MCSTFSHIYPSATTSCASKAVFREEGCDTCTTRGTASRAGWTPSRPLSGFNAALTMSVWVKPLRSDFSYGEIFGDGGSGNGFNLGWNPQRGVLGCGGWHHQTKIAVGEWSHIVLVYRGSSGCSLLVNGHRHEGDHKLNVGPIQPAIGCRGSGICSRKHPQYPTCGLADPQLCSGDYSFVGGGRGAITQLSMWNRALSNAEIAALRDDTNTPLPLSAAVCRAETKPTQPPKPSPVQELLERVAQLESKVAELSALKVRRESGKCIVQCDNGKDGGELMLD